MRRYVKILSAWGLCWASACASTTPEKQGQLMLTLQTDMSIPKDIDSVRIEVRSYGMLQFASDFELGQAGLKLPATLGVVAGKDASAPVSIRVLAFQNEIPRILRELVTTVPPDRVATLPVPLHWLCADARSVKKDAQGEVQSSCGDGQTCVSGSCDSVAVVSNELPAYTEAAVFGGGTLAGEGQCFDLADCFATPFPIVAQQPGCRISLPPGQDPKLMNFALRGPSTGAGVCNRAGCFVAIDFDAQAGWKLEGSQIVFPKAVCEVATLGVELVVAQGCAPKSASTPTCGPWSAVSGEPVGKLSGAPSNPPAPTTSMGPPNPQNPPMQTEQILASGFQALGAIAVNNDGVFWVGERGGLNGIYRCGFDGCGLNPVSVFSGPGRVLALALTSDAIVFSQQAAQGNGGAILSCPLPNGCDQEVMPKVIASTAVSAPVMAVGATDVYWREEPSKFLSCSLGMQCGAAARVFAQEPAFVGDMQFAEGRIFWSEPLTGEIRYCLGLECLGGPQSFVLQQTMPTRLAIGGSHVYWLNEGKLVMDCPLQNCGGGGLGIYAHDGASALAVDARGVFVADQTQPNSWEIVQVVASQPPTPPVQVWSGPSATINMALDPTRIYFTSADGNVRRTQRPVSLTPLP